MSSFNIYIYSASLEATYPWNIYIYTVHCSRLPIPGTYIYIQCIARGYLSLEHIYIVHRSRLPIPGTYIYTVHRSRLPIPGTANSPKQFCQLSCHTQTYCQKNLRHSTNIQPVPGPYHTLSLSLVHTIACVVPHTHPVPGPYHSLYCSTHPACPWSIP